MASAKKPSDKPNKFSKAIDKRKAPYLEAEKGLIARAVLFLLHKHPGQEEPKGWNLKRWEMVKNLIRSQRTMSAVQHQFGKWLREDKLEGSVWWKVCKQVAGTQDYYEAEFKDAYAKMRNLPPSIQRTDSERVPHKQPSAVQQSMDTSVEPAKLLIERTSDRNNNHGTPLQMAQVNEDAHSKAGASTNAAGKQQQGMQGETHYALPLAAPAVVRKSDSSAESTQHLVEMVSDGNGDHKPFTSSRLYRPCIPHSSSKECSRAHSPFLRFSGGGGGGVEAKPRGQSAAPTSGRSFLSYPFRGETWRPIAQASHWPSGASTSAAGKQHHMQGASSSSGNGEGRPQNPHAIMMEVGRPTGTGQMKVPTNGEVQPGQSGNSKKVHQRLKQVPNVLVKNIGRLLAQSSSKTAHNGGDSPSNLSTHQLLLKDDNAEETHLRHLSALEVVGERSGAPVIHLHNCPITIIEKVEGNLILPSAEHAQQL